MSSHPKGPRQKFIEAQIPSGTNRLKIEFEEASAMGFSSRVVKFRIFWQAFGLTLLAGTLGACSLINDSATPKMPSSPQALDMGCLQDLVGNLTDYFEGRVASDEAIAQPWDCGRVTLATFTKMSRGQQPDQYSSQELQGMMNLFLPPQHQVSDALRVDVMKLKVVLFGGSQEALSREDIERVSDFLGLLKQEAFRLRNNFPVSRQRFSERSREEISELQDAALTSAKKIGKFIGETKQPYPLSDVSNLLMEIDKMVGPLESTGAHAAFGGQPSLGSAATLGAATSGRGTGLAQSQGSSLKWLAHHLPLLGQLKGVIFGTREDQIDPAEWTRFLEVAVRGQSLYALWIHLDARAGVTWLSSNGRKGMSELISETQRFVESLVRLPGQGKVSADATRQFLNTLAKSEPLSGEVDPFVKDLSQATAGLVLAKQVLFGGEPYALDLGRISGLLVFPSHLNTDFLELANLLESRGLNGLAEAEWEFVLSRTENALASLGAALESIPREAHPQDRIEGWFDLALELGPWIHRSDLLAQVPLAAHLFKTTAPLLIGSSERRIVPGLWESLLRRTGRILKFGIATHLKARASELSRANVRSPSPGETSPSGRRRGLSSTETEVFVRDALALAQSLLSEPLTEFDLRAVLEGLLAPIASSLNLPIETLKQVHVAIPDLYRLKQFFVGGSTSQLERGELERLGGLILLGLNHWESLRQVFLEPPEDFSSWTSDRWLRAQDAVLRVTEHLSASLASYPLGQLDLQDLLNLAARFNSLFPPNQLAEWNALLPLVRAMMPILTGLPSRPLKGAEWTQLIQRLGRWAHLGLKGAQLASNLNLGSQKSRHSQATLDQIREVGFAGIDLLSSLIPSAAGGDGLLPVREIPFEQLEGGIEALEHFLQQRGSRLPMSAKTINGFLRPAIRRLLGGNRRGPDGRMANGLTPQALDLVKSKVSLWYWLHSYLLTLYPDAEGAKRGRTREELVQQIDQLFQSVTGDAATRKERLAALNLLKRVVTVYRPMLLGDDEIISFLYDEDQENLYSANHLSVYGVYQILLKTFIQGYAEDSERAEKGKGVSISELELFVADTFEVIRELKLGNPDQTARDLAQQNFFLANLFMSTSNGGLFFDLDESSEFLSFMLSVQNHNQRVYQDMLAHCPQGPLDFSGVPKIEVSCYLNRFFRVSTFTKNFSQFLPRMVQEFTNHSDAKRGRFAKNLQLASLNQNVRVRTTIDSAESQNFVAFLAYTESLFKRFDTNRTGIMSIPEALKAYPLVCYKLIEASQGKFKDNCEKPHWSDLEALFGYLLVHGTPPNSNSKNVWDDIANAIHWLAWDVKWAYIRNFPGLPGTKFRIDRERILSIVGAMATVSSR
jgi:hypothetical protein